MQPSTVSIVIRVRNAEKDLQCCLDILRQQFLPDNTELEIVVVDNESVDGSVQVAKAYGAKVVNLPAIEFSWGRALNRGIVATSGEIVLLLSADAYPSGNNWIKEMLAPFKNSKVAAVYGRQVPRQDAPIDEIVRLRKTFPDYDIKYNQESLRNGLGSTIIASNACAAIRKCLWELHQFDEQSDGAEERPWLHQVLSSGYMCSYCANAVVYHSHNDTLFRNAFRLVELWKEYCIRNNKCFGILFFFKSVLSYIKKRLTNVIFCKSSIVKRTQYLCRLPFEVVAMTFIYMIISSPLKRYRSNLWG